MTVARILDPYFGKAVITYLTAALVLGGASAAGIIANLFLQLGAILLVLWSVSRLDGASIDRRTRWAIGILAGALLLPLLQIIPLPSGIWSALPGREAIVSDYALLGVELPALGISLSAERTVAAWLALLPPAAVFMATLTLDERERGLMVAAVVALAFLSVLIGFIQVTSRDQLYIYSITNGGSAVGFFANRNHLASLLLMSIPFITLLLRSAGGVDLPRASRVGRRILIGASLLILSVGILFTGSRAGLLLLFPVLFLTYVTMLRTSRGATPQIMAIGGALLVVGVLGAMSYGPFYERITERSQNFQEDVRYWAAPITLKSSVNNLPFGTGFGTFDPVFRRAAGDANLGPSFVNHAHNDYLELFLTGGVPALLLIALFLGWAAMVTQSNWRMRSGNPSALARASAIVILVALLHSGVDYPLRTAALACLFAAACAFQLSPLGRGTQSLPREDMPFERRSLAMTDLRVARSRRRSRR